jgi:histidine triad (HIT) family protein
MDTCVFCKIRDRIIPKEFTYEDSDIMVFPDIRPVAPIHLLIVPKRHIGDFGDVRGVRDDALFLKIKRITQKMIKEQKIEDKGYRLVVNGGGAQIIDHLHIHLMGEIGQKLKM